MIESGQKICVRQWGKPNDLLEDIHFSRLDQLVDVALSNLMLVDVEQQFDDLDGFQTHLLDLVKIVDRYSS